MSVGCVIVAAGAGVRMGSSLPKALVPVAGRPMLAWSVEAAGASGVVDEVVVVAPPGRLNDVSVVIGATGPGARIVAGQATRAESVLAGLRALSADIDRVLVHDAARPLVPPLLFRSVVEALDRDTDGAISATPLADTLKRVSDDGEVVATIDRAGLWCAQTPQGFHLDALLGAYAACDEDQIPLATDCASLVELAGGRVRIVAGPASNMKVTIPSDVAIAEHLLVAAGRAHASGPLRAR